MSEELPEDSVVGMEMHIKAKVGARSCSMMGS